MAGFEKLTDFDKYKVIGHCSCEYAPPKSISGLKTLFDISGTAALPARKVKYKARSVDQLKVDVDKAKLSKLKYTTLSSLLDKVIVVNPISADADALALDWKTVGDDFRIAYKALGEQVHGL